MFQTQIKSSAELEVTVQCFFVASGSLWTKWNCIFFFSFLPVVLSYGSTMCFPRYRGALHTPVIMSSMPPKPACFSLGIMSLSKFVIYFGRFKKVEIDISSCNPSWIILEQYNVINLINWEMA